MTLNPANPVATVRPGEKIDKFEILEQVGVGGMSIVWKGYDRLLARPVALKQLLLGAGSDAEVMRERFRAEADLHKRVSQDNRHIVRVLDFIEDPRGFFIVMEFVEGSSLEQVLAAQTGPVDERRALGVVGATAVALETIHDFGILHRDLKPSNILLPRHGGLKVTDFGLSALIADQDTLTLGSVRYMAPELFNAVPADARADIYSLGMITYEMLAGRAKFEEAFKIVLRDQRNQSLRWMKWHTNLRVKAPPLNQLNPEVSATLSEMVARMMEKDPLARISSAAELLATIRRHFAGGTDEIPSRTPVRRPGGLAGPGVLAGSASDGPGPGDAPGTGAESDVAQARHVTANRPAGSTHATAPLPRRGRLAKYLVAALVLELVVLGVAVMVHDAKRREAVTLRVDAVKQAMTAADASFATNHLDDARDAYLKLAQKWKGQPLAATYVARANAMTLLCQAQIDNDAGKFDQALSEVEQARQSKAITARGDTDKVQGVTERAMHGVSFRKLVAQINQAIDQQRYADAMQGIREAHNSSPTPDEDQQVQDLQAKITGLAQQKILDQEVAQVLSDAADLVKHDHRDQAITMLNQANEQTPSPRLQKYADQLTRQISFEQATADAKAAEQGGNLPGAIDAYTRALALQADPATAAHLQDLRSRQALEEGRKLLAAGDKVGAAAAFERSIQAKDNTEAQDALKQIAVEKQREVHIRAAEGAEQSGDFAGAIAEYTKALESGPDAAVTAKLDAARAHQAIKAGLNALTQAKVDEAETDLKIARDAAHGSADLKKEIDDLDHRVSYRKHIDAGDALRKQSRYGEASMEYRKARDLMATKEVADRLDDTEYEHLLAQAKAYMDNQQWVSAKSEALSAYHIHATAQAKALLDTINAHVSTQGSGNGGSNGSL